MIHPPVLRPGDTVALIAPAGPVDDETINRAVRRCRDLGLEPELGASVRARRGYLAGSDRERASDLATAIQGEAAAVWALRGGYGTLRTLEHLDLTPLRDRPKAFIGFSDNTVIHLALLGHGVVSFHGPHAGYEHFPAATEAAFRAVVMTPEPAGVLPVPDTARVETVVPGAAEGPLVGGNLSLLAATCGTRYQPDTRGAILFLEDVAEPAYRIDRMVNQLRLAGLLDEVAAVALGEFVGPEADSDEARGTVAADTSDGSARDSEAGDAHREPDSTGPTLHALFTELLAPLGVPVALGLPFGHGRENWTLPLGVPARLDAAAGTLELLGAATITRGRDG